MAEDKNKDLETAAAEADAVITAIDEFRTARKQNPQGFRDMLRNVAIRLGLTFLFSQRK